MAPTTSDLIVERLLEWGSGHVLRASRRWDQLVTNATALAGAVAAVIFLALYMSISPGSLVSGFPSASFGR